MRDPLLVSKSRASNRSSAMRKVHIAQLQVSDRMRYEALYFVSLNVILRSVIRLVTMMFAVVWAPTPHLRLGSLHICHIFVDVADHIKPHNREPLTNCHILKYYSSLKLLFFLETILFHVVVGLIHLYLIYTPVS